MPPRRKQVTYSRRPTHAARAAHARGERQFRKYDTSYIRPKRSAAPIVFTVILAIVVLGGLGFGAFYLFNSCSSSSVELLAEGEEATVVVEEGAGARDIGQRLVEARLVPTSAEFTKRVNELGVDGGLKPGTYTFSGGTSLDDIIRTLQAGPAAGHTLTVPEGFTLGQIASSVAEATGAASRRRRSRPPLPMRASMPRTLRFWPMRDRTASKASCSRKLTRSMTMPRQTRSSA